MLRSWRSADATWYVTARDEEVFQWTTEPRDLTAQTVRAAFVHFDDVPDMYCFAIADRATGELVGNLPVELHDDGTADIAYWLAASRRGRGYLNDSLQLVLAWLPTIGAKRAELEVLPENNASIRAAERAGFRSVGKRTHARLGPVIAYRLILG